MKFARYKLNRTVGYGIVEGNSLRTLDGCPFTDYSETGDTVALEDVQLLAPATPSKVLAVGLNYRSHLGDAPEPKNPEIFIKTPSCINDPEGEIVLPEGDDDVHAEGELVVLMKEQTSKATPAEAEANILGVTCGNDVSARTWQSNDMQWWRAKASDTFGPIGPVIATGLDYGDLQLETRINGDVVQSQTTGDLIFPVPVIVSFISQAITLEPGDAVFTGTPGTTTALQDGDVVEVEIEGIGVLRNTVVA
ncbi:MAG: fumarylacetoacetate hydrolase family protein [Candidatus Poribacteria bacterium]|nr:fumarylacetoacetate hydrolase family protein [Candidatus Poribacteria bacterium]